ncbi:MAG: lysine--tRNA ligase [Candidatus Marinimicrobia bacterium]|nr:lysine--tRNA ligase [Candidatus Neomarinimicrobiota bacterium]MBT3633361.1 lysine--tRNA ligase [Candidatus Neomarinimicrobiota bacterium]MBT3681504.1 lysine--tRNA ligase [Candidatus Neomarinimicrobiota bacterium]MBT3758529.1 lysine--tRNA ligase [Candidatus Neomarinimicrobiota bacterium]MBT3894817.1 lysine--tRNA ligase [Candidatus Neomarinimicrobiota bacterium]
MSTDNKSLKRIIDFRHEKLDAIKNSGINPFPYSFDRTDYADDVIKSYDPDSDKKQVSIAGRIVSMRKMGKASFTHLQDESGKIQLYIKRDDVGVDVYNNLFKNLDLGDIIGVTGYVFVTRTEEISVHAEFLTILSKNLRPLPNLKEKDGVAFNEYGDKELRYRHRYLDFIANPQNKIIFEQRATIISAMRSVLDSNGFLEVETPILQQIYGGASARPFKTFHNTLDESLYLRIADELYLKKLIIGGFEKVYELAKNFRNEGMDRSHNPEYTSLEFYQAYVDVYYMMDFTEMLIKTIAQKLNVDTVEFNSFKISLSKPFEKKSMFELLNNASGKSVDTMDRLGLYEYAKELKLEIDKKMNYGQLLDAIFEHLVEPTLINPTFVYDYPKAISPLAKGKRDGNQDIVERFELFIGCTEFANAFSELNDPIDQRQRLESQAKLREIGDEEAQNVDNDFIEAMECGMPPTGGVGIGVDRIVMLLTGQNSIKDVILFPAMRTEKEK